MPFLPSGDVEIAIDGHVHLHEPEFDIAALEVAAENFAACCPVSSRIGALLLAELAGQDAFSRLSALSLRSSEEPSVTATSESTSLWYSVGNWRLLIVASRQVVTAEGLEVLVIGTRQRFEQGLALDSLLAEVRVADALAVFPWGCGKWLGRRGRLVQRVLLRAPADEVFVGDNGGRPGWWRSVLFEIAARRHVATLPGSDPLPLDLEWKRIGRYGFALALGLSVDKPVADLKAALRDRQRRLRRYGEQETFARFIRNQLRLRLFARRNRPGNLNSHGT